MMFFFDFLNTWACELLLCLRRNHTWTTYPRGFGKEFLRRRRAHRHLWRESCGDEKRTAKCDTDDATDWCKGLYSAPKCERVSENIRYAKTARDSKSFIRKIKNDAHSSRTSVNFFQIHLIAAHIDILMIWLWSGRFFFKSSTLTSPPWNNGEVVSRRSGCNKQ